MWRSRLTRRREHVWGALAALALCWPGRLATPLDGFPLDAPLEAILIGAAFPALWWFSPAFLTTRFARAAILLLLALKAATALTLTQDGWCVAFDTPKPIVRDSTGRPHSWDIRADWRSSDPRCSAIMTRAYPGPRDFPAFFLNLSPADNSQPRPEDRPPLTVFDMRVRGYLQPGRPGEFALETAPGMSTTVHVNGREVGSAGGATVATTLAAGRHLVEIDATLTGYSWRLRPTWNGDAFGENGFPTATLESPARIDRAVRPWLAWTTALLAGALLAGWLMAWMASLRARLIAGIAIAASIALAAAGSLELATSLPVLAGLLLLACVDLPANLRNTRGVFLLVGLPWLALVAGAHADEIGRFKLLEGGHDWWGFQRYAYRIYLQGYWLEGGQETFWFQPLYRWIAGALHLAFGDSHFGEYMWDGACVLATTFLAYAVTRRSFGFRAGLAAAVLALAMVLRGPGWSFVGRGLSEWSVAGFLSLAALLAMRERRGRIAWRPGLLSVLGWYTRLNHLPMALGVAAFALRTRTPARDLLRSARAWHSLRIGVAVGIPLATLVGLLLFAWRTWYYTGVFSVTHGTSISMLALSQQGQSYGEVLARMAESLAMLLSMADPPRYNIVALPLMIAGAVSIAALVGVPLVRNLPGAAVLFFLSGCVGALVARGSAYPGRFSLHLIGISSALTVSTIVLLYRRAQQARRS